MRFQTACLVVSSIISLFLFTSCSNQFYNSGTAAKKTNTRTQPKFIKDVAIAPKGKCRINTTIPSSTHSQKQSLANPAGGSHFSKYEKRKNYNHPSAGSPGTRTIIVKPGNRNTVTTALPGKEAGGETYIADESFREICTKYANILGISAASALMHNITLYSFIDEWYGVPYQYGGNDKSGIDCSAFVQRLYENVFCMDLVRTAFQQFSDCDLVENTENLREGDLVFFYSISRSRKSKKVRRRISHVGIYLANDYFVHASTSSGVMISNLRDNYWSRKFAGAGQIPGI